jgi:hypothetical protein
MFCFATKSKCMNRFIARHGSDVLPRKSASDSNVA